MIGCYKSYYIEQNGAHHLIGEVLASLGYMLVVIESLYPFFRLTLSPDKV